MGTCFVLRQQSTVGTSCDNVKFLIVVLHIAAHFNLLHGWKTR